MTAAIERRQPVVKDAARIETDGRIAVLFLR